MGKKRKVVFFVYHDKVYDWGWSCWIGKVKCESVCSYVTKRNATNGARCWAKSTLADNFEVEICYG